MNPQNVHAKLVSRTDPLGPVLCSFRRCTAWPQNGAYVCRNRVILYRRFMVRITEALAQRRGAKAIVTGESCGQVSSQTLDNIPVIDRAAEMPILRPLVGFNKEEIVNVARSIGTFATSILPDQDCCTLFIPRHPETHADLKTVDRLEATLPVDDLVQEALANTELKEVVCEQIGEPAR